MGKRHRDLPAQITAHDSFIYLLAEIGRTLDQGEIQWTAVSVEAARCRLEDLVVRLAAIDRRIRET